VKPSLRHSKTQIFWATELYREVAPAGMSP